MTDRYPPIPETEWTEAQRHFARPLIEGPRGGVISPFVPLLRSPELMDRVQAVGEYLRFGSAIGRRLTELAILVTARHWDQPVEWAIHAPMAVAEGIEPAVVAALAAGETPQFAREDEAVVHAAATALLAERRLPDTVHDRAAALWGPQGVIDLFGVIGYYSMLSVVMNGAQTAIPETGAPPLAPRSASAIRNGDGEVPRRLFPGGEDQG